MSGDLAPAPPLLPIPPSFPAPHAQYSKSLNIGMHTKFRMFFRWFTMLETTPVEYPMITDLHDHQLEATYARFVELLGGKPWLKVTQDHQFQFTANPLSEVQITREYSVAYGLASFDQKGMALQGSSEWSTALHGLTFAAQACQLAENDFDERSRRSFIGRVRGAFSNPDDMRALRFEMLTALSLYKQGARIHWPESTEGPETFDILATTKDGLEVEVECKSISADKGRPIKERDAGELFNRLLRKLPVTHKAGELLLVKIQIPEKLSKSHAELDRLASGIADAFKASRSEASENIFINQKVVEAPFLFDPKSDDYIRFAIGELADRASGPAEGHRAIAYSSGSKTGLCIEITSTQASQVLEAMRQTANRAVRKQMTGTRPGCLVLRMEGLSRESLIQLASEDPNPLAFFATEILKDPRHQHLACIAFVSDSDLIPISETTQTEQSVSYVFDQQVGPLAGLGLGAVFRGVAVSERQR